LQTFRKISDIAAMGCRNNQPLEVGTERELIGAGEGLEAEVL
jgi:hypothetical protein